MSANLPLEGIRVLDLGWRAVAPVCARMLALSSRTITAAIEAPLVRWKDSLEHFTKGVEASTARAKSRRMRRESKSLYYFVALY